MNEAWIIDACRTPRGIGKKGKGALADQHPQHLGAIVLKALAEYLDLSLGDLLEGIVLHAFEAKPPFHPETVAKIEQLKDVYGCKLTAAHSHRMIEES